MKRDAIIGELQIASRNLVRHRARTSMTLVAIAFGVVALVLSGGFIEDMFFQLRETTINTRLGHIQVSRAGYYLHGRKDPFKYMLKDPRAVVDVLAGDPRVRSVTARLSLQGLLSNGRSDLPIAAEGVEIGAERAPGGHVTMIAGRPLAAGDAFGAMIGEGVAHSMKLAPGDFFTLAVNTPDGALNSLDFRVTGTFRTFSKDFDDRAVRVSIDAARELLTSKGAHTLVISLQDTEATAAVGAKLKNALDDQAYEVKTWLELDDFYPKTVALYKRQFGILQLIILAIVMLTVANTVNMTAFERQGEYGTIRALGGKQRGIFRMIMIENLLLGIVGTLLGLLVATILAVLISLVGITMPPPPNANGAYIARIQLVPSVMIIAALIGIGATLGSAVLAAVRISRTPIADALRQNV